MPLSPRPRPASHAPRAGVILPLRVIAAPALTYRTIDPDSPADADLAVEAYLEACRASYGEDSAFPGRRKHLDWLRSRVEEFPDGHVLAFDGPTYVGQLELQVPYGLTTGYVNLYYVAEASRGKGYGRRLHEYADRYFRSWEATRIELHVSPLNDKALGFYRHIGYRLAKVEGRLWRMTRPVI
jgi:GNAT superfamily N-acetyltransferase